VNRLAVVAEWNIAQQSVVITTCAPNDGWRVQVRDRCGNSAELLLRDVDMVEFARAIAQAVALAGGK
jgi:hypothetical protein